MPPPFSEDELVLLLDAHLRRVDGESVDGSELSERLRALHGDRGTEKAFRTRDGVLRAMRRFDVYARGSSDRDSPHYRAIWERYASDRPALAAAAARIEADTQPGELPHDALTAAAPTGRAYRHEDTSVTVAERDPFPVDPAIVERGLRSHRRLQNQLADAVAAAGLRPESPAADTAYDLAWRDGDVLWVAEVKSLTAENEKRQLRLGLGQVLHYRHLLASEATEVRAMLYVERRPRDMAWTEICRSVGVELRWPGADG